MEIFVYDTYAKAKNGDLMHFDVFINERNDDKAYEYAKKWLDEIGADAELLKQEHCSFCHSQPIDQPEIAKEIEENGRFIYKMEGCPA